MMRRGTTLIEMIVTIVLLGIVASVVALAARPSPPRGDDLGTRVALARRQALESRRPVTIEVVVDGRPLVATMFPDGRATGDSALGVDPLTGAVTNAR